MEKAKRYIIFLIGLFINSLGVSLITLADLGTSPISSVPYVLSLNFPLTLGVFTILFNVFLIALQLIILRKNFKPEYFLQIPATILFGYFIDLTMSLFSFIHPEMYLLKIVYLLIGCVVLGFGVYLEVLANVVMLPGESFVRAVSSAWDKEFGITKVGFDVTLAVSAAVLSLILARRLDGVREGTIIAALLVGFIARLFGRMLKFLDPLLFPRKEKTFPDSGTPSGNTGGPVVVIDRQYGSGGHDIGRQLAQKMGFAFYDNEIIHLTVGDTGYSHQYIREREEKMTNSLLYDLVSQVYIYSSEYQAPKDAIYESEANLIRRLADKGNCVIVGRCADYILKDHPNCLSVFLHASSSFRAKRIMEKEQLSRPEAEQKIQKTDRFRADHYHYYTGRMWGHSRNYDLSLDTELGEEAVEEIISQVLQGKLKAEKNIRCTA